MKLSGNNKNLRDVKSSIEVFLEEEETFVVAVAVSKNEDYNKIHRIKCDGIAIGGYAYDSNSDTCYVEGCDYISLGLIPISFTMKIKGASRYQISIPLPESVVKRSLDVGQKRLLKKFSSKFSKDRYKIDFFQMTGVNS
jgi:hypothetical protein